VDISELSFIITLISASLSLSYTPKVPLFTRLIVLGRMGTRKHYSISTEKISYKISKSPSTAPNSIPISAPWLSLGLMRMSGVLNSFAIR